MRRSPLLILLLSIALHIDVAADELVVAESTSSFETSSGAYHAQAVPTGAVRDDKKFVGPALEPSSTIAGTFDYSYFLVLGLGLGGLVWMRRQSQSL